MTAAERAIVRALRISWWALLVPFAVLTARFSFERGCQDPYELLRPVMQHQIGALTVAVIYVGSYVWFVAAVILSARQWDGGAVTHLLERVWGHHAWKLVVLGAALLVENIPRVFWQWLYAAIGAC